MNNLPVELLIKIFSYLTPIPNQNQNQNQNNKLNLVCKKWNNILSTDYYWQKAFLYYSRNKSPFQRLNSGSWKLEFLKRQSLLELFLNSKSIHVIQLNQLQDEILRLYLAADDYLICICLQGIKVYQKKDLVLRFRIDSELEITSCKFINGKIVLGLLDGSLVLVDRLFSNDICFNSIQKRHSSKIIGMQSFFAAKSALNNLLPSAGIYFITFSVNCLNLFSFGGGGIDDIVWISEFSLDLTDQILNVAVDSRSLIVIIQCKRKLYLNLMLSKSIASLSLSKGSSQMLFDPGLNILYLSVDHCLQIYDLSQNTFKLIHSLDCLNLITCFTWLGEGQRFCLISGTITGNVFVYDVSNCVKSNPSLAFKIDHSNSPVSHIQADAFKIVVGYQDGWLFVYDFLLGQIIRKLKHHSSFSSHQMQIVMNLSYIACGAGSFLKVYDFDLRGLLVQYERKNQQKKKKTRTSQVGYKSPRAQLLYDAKLDTKEGNRVMQREKSAIASSSSAKFLNDLEYAKMLSLEQHHHQSQSINNSRPMAFPTHNSPASQKLPSPAFASEEDLWPKLGTSNSSKSPGLKSTTSPNMYPQSSPSTLKSPSSSSITRPRKLSFSQFMDEFKLEEPAIATNANEQPISSSYRHIFRYRDDFEDEEEEEKEEEEYFESHLGDLYGNRRKTSDYTSVQVKKREDEELLYVLELSMIEK